MPIDEMLSKLRVILERFDESRNEEGFRDIRLELLNILYYCENLVDD